jgi:hypothetical protein
VQLAVQQVSLSALWFPAVAHMQFRILTVVDQAVSAEQILVYQLFQELLNLQEPADTNTGNMFQTDHTLVQASELVGITVFQAADVRVSEVLHHSRVVAAVALSHMVADAAGVTMVPAA